MVEPASMRADREYASFTVSETGKMTKVTRGIIRPRGYCQLLQHAEGNSLPHELSPAFFRPEVLSKYKADRDKYTVDEEHRFISCRGAWELKILSTSTTRAKSTHTFADLQASSPIRSNFTGKSHNEESKRDDF